jgi:hypothetical protein
MSMEKRQVNCPIAVFLVLTGLPACESQACGDAKRNLKGTPGAPWYLTDVKRDCPADDSEASALVAREEAAADEREGKARLEQVEAQRRYEAARAKALADAAPFRNWFERLSFGFRESRPPDGALSLAGTNEDGTMVMFDVRESVVTSAALMFALSRDTPEATVRTTGAIMVFTRETGWPEGNNWVVAQLEKGGGKKAQARVAYEVASVKEAGIHTLTASPVSAAVDGGVP